MPDNDIYLESLWVLALFASTAILREAVGELAVIHISKAILHSSFLPGNILDLFISCSNGGRSLGFGAIYRMWNCDKSRKIVSRAAIAAPFLCWMIGMPIKILAVQAVRGGLPVIGELGTWILGGSWIAFGVLVKIYAMILDRTTGLLDHNGKRVSYRRVFNERFCKLDGLGQLVWPQFYDNPHASLISTPKAGTLGFQISYQNPEEDDDLSTGSMSTKLSDSSMDSSDNYSAAISTTQPVYGSVGSPPRSVSARVPGSISMTASSSVPPAQISKARGYVRLVMRLTVRHMDGSFESYRPVDEPVSPTSPTSSTASKNTNALVILCKHPDPRDLEEGRYARSQNQYQGSSGVEISVSTSTSAT